ncbi:hypothetical protein COT48_03080 [Candidatus Woesearchaeota archaeon CG08_land_8_20_14_0_20_47_9]|nr:MAG: hypothetical protein AUJ69_03175 [Candidatus Woesearchaeota archaeon CG1_02_47_18]PIN75202.1 MAG: hypothetical protein COV22_00920 [Candidatus Woesearchaeota archaeon CG10_big_fil_rev_8_21_14_0_10_47_5]PIO03910.1 MAG: hypothetical protein COT48_03080 [Candidatus Woesearchaeota archaeon CG08_land_8_20_14_0_20_47_9]HII29685.1 hypothetical protein [Candidatus Woesearchaeota archaeon]
MRLREVFAGFIAILIVMATMVGALAGGAECNPNCPEGCVVVAGTVTWADMVTPVQGADVSVECNGNLRSTSTDEDGTYAVGYCPADCDEGDTATVTASKDSASGNNSGTVGAVGGIKVALVDVVIPEFAAGAAGVAFLGAAIGYAFMRSRN